MRARLLLVVLLAVFGAACRADVLLDVTVEEDGSGLVTLRIDADASAVDALPELVDGLRTEDLAAAGWNLEQETFGGGVRWVATKGFGSPEAFTGVVAEIAGPELLFRDAVVELVEEQDRREYRLSVVVDPGIEPADLSDAELAALLDGAPLGGLSEELAAADVSVTVRLATPGGADPTEATVDIGDAAREVVSSSAIVDDTALALRDEAAALRRWAVIAAIAVAVGLVVVAGLWLLEIRRSRLRRAVAASDLVDLGAPPRSAPGPAQGSAQTSVAPVGPAPSTPGSGPGRPGLRSTPRTPPADRSDGIEVDTGTWSPGETG